MGYNMPLAKQANTDSLSFTASPHRNFSVKEQQNTLCVLPEGTAMLGTKRTQGLKNSRPLPNSFRCNYGSFCLLAGP